MKIDTTVKIAVYGDTYLGEEDTIIISFTESSNLQRGTIPLIKEIRRQTGMTLMDSKNFVEVNFFNYPIPKEALK